MIARQAAPGVAALAAGGEAHHIHVGRYYYYYYYYSAQYICI